MKLVLYCPKTKPYLFDFILDQYPNRYGLYDTKKDCDSEEEALNGKIVGECDFEVEKIEYKHIHERDKFGILHNEFNI